MSLFAHQSINPGAHVSGCNCQLCTANWQYLHQHDRYGQHYGNWPLPGGIVYETINQSNNSITVPKGWICPKCDTANAPSLMQCPCNGKK